MKSSSAVFEIILAAITFLAGMITLASKDFFPTFLVWMLVLGILQVFHSLMISIENWQYIKIRTAILIYWAGVILNFFIFSIDKVMSNQSSPFEIFSMLVLPITLTVYLLWISCYFSEILKKNKSS